MNFDSDDFFPTAFRIEEAVRIDDDTNTFSTNSRMIKMEPMIESISEDEENSENSGADCNKEEKIRKVHEHISAISPPQIIRLLGDRLMSIIRSLHQNGNYRHPDRIKDIMKENFDISLFRTKNEKKILFEMEVVVKAAAVYYLSIGMENIFEMYNTTEELLQEYPTFLSYDVEIWELKNLLVYRNMMRLALDIIPAKCNKHLLMRICATLEGSGKAYLTGGTQSLATTRRVLIYERESNIKRPELWILRHPFPPAKSDLLTCECGSVILKRTMWKHKTSIRHTSYLMNKLNK